MPTTFVTDKVDPVRIDQYATGLAHVPDIKGADYVVCDNSSGGTAAPSGLDRFTIIPGPNVYGKYNKGSGIIECWRAHRDLIEQYDFIIHFEPRQQLLSSEMIDDFLSSPRNLFTMGAEGNHFNTGLFMISSGLLVKFIGEYTPQQLIFRNMGLEYALFEFMSDRPYSLARRMHLLWHDTAAGRVREM